MAQISDHLKNNVKRFILLVKLHPKENRKNYKSFAFKTSEKRVIFVQNELTSAECLKIADEIYGMTSIMLIEGYIYGLKVISIQPSLKIDDPLVLSRLRYISLITSLSGFTKNIRKYIKRDVAVKFNKRKFMGLVKRLVS